MNVSINDSQALFQCSLSRQRSQSCPEFSHKFQQSSTSAFSDETLPSKSRIIFQKKAYHFNTSYKNTYYYKCADKSCKGRLKFKWQDMTWKESFTHTCSNDIEGDNSMAQLASLTEVEMCIKKYV
jgi:hypothetical protein